MSESSENDAPVDQDREQLVAYLDGELGAEEGRAIEQRLAEDDAFRVEMQEIESAWSALDCLPRASVDEKFAQTTVEMVALKAEEQLDEYRAELPRKRRLDWLLGAVGMATAAAAAFVVISLLLTPQENEQLVRDLPVIENLDAYQQVGEVEFLRLLQEDNLFSEEETDEVGLPLVEE